MKPLLLNTFEIGGGAAIATSRLHKGLLSIGIDSQLLVQNKKTDDRTVIGCSTKIAKAIAVLRPHLDRLFIWPYRKKSLFSPANLYDGLAAKIDEINPDVVHLFWVSGGDCRKRSPREAFIVRNIRIPSYACNCEHSYDVRFSSHYGSSFDSRKLWGKFCFDGNDGLRNITKHL